MSGSMQSGAGNKQTYEDGDQKNTQGSIQDSVKPFEVAPDNAHAMLDSKDQRSIANRLGAASAQHYDNESNKTKDTIEDPTEPARSHGNEPSRGAQIDAELKAEEEEYLKNKGKI
ncbi:hypothetical protein K435DRAFT_782181 [Dendrothele bispora CBS 962.96]|uniref:Uncharacterized protein n=1 Tax=Dendrothele bispora (strain CBS 962.96) TaxID=1314807 RepID=A0A4V6T572_DENBC|nr:hypothetical protein K435DRAFT_782181 [Dendrothele bispora CBS 962.96]